MTDPTLFAHFKPGEGFFEGGRFLGYYIENGQSFLIKAAFIRRRTSIGRVMAGSISSSGCARLRQAALIKSNCRLKREQYLHMARCIKIMMR